MMRCYGYTRVHWLSDKPMEWPMHKMPSIEFDEKLDDWQVKQLHENVDQFVRPNIPATLAEVRENCKRLGLPMPVDFYLPCKPKAS